MKTGDYSMHFKAIAIAALLLTSVAGNAQAQCGPCQPAVKAGFSPGHPMTVYLDPSLTQNELAKTTDAINAWNQWSLNMGMAAYITLTNNPATATIQVRENPALANSPTTGAQFNNLTMVLEINPLYSGRTDAFYGQIMTHEMGHAIGFRDVYTSGCGPTQTIMWGNIDQNQGPYYTVPGSADLCTMNALNPQPPPDPCPGGICGGEPVGVDGWWCPGGGCDPLVLDLNGDGIHTTGPESPVWFDLNGDGTKEHLTWTNASTMEGFLWINLSGKNRVDNGTELFGIGTVMPDGSRPNDAFEALAVYDRPDYGGNGDGLIDSNDEVWNRLRVWVDSNHNGVCEPGEVRPIHAYGIEAIQLRTVTAMTKDSAGNVHQRQGTYYRNEHGQRVPYSVESLRFSQVN